ncbi:MAG: hypothetical protein JXJ18_07255 [Rhodobacteraceae bacterium]|nr:hypothetical protein [Paracoccaceae bacterium]
MTNAVTVAFVGMILTALLADYIFNDMTASLFLARKFIDLSEYIAFWR